MLDGGDFEGLVRWVEEHFGTPAGWVLAAVIVILLVGSIGAIFVRF